LDITVREIGPSLLADYFAFFDHIYETDAWLNFKDNPWWSGCYCGFFDHKRPENEITALGVPERKRLRSERIASGKATGFLAYSDGKAVGWCNAGPRADYVSLQNLSVAVQDPTESVGSILCFVVKSQYRGQGVATALLNSACSSFKRSGLKYAEGYPRTRPANVDNPHNIPEEHLNYYGPLQMYLKAGFEVHRQFEKFAAVRKPLQD
jgi:ribosomal protein S18 acetylase RimI-like enzyme